MVVRSLWSASVCRQKSSQQKRTRGKRERPRLPKQNIPEKHKKHGTKAKSDTPETKAGDKEKSAKAKPRASEGELKAKGNATSAEKKENSETAGKSTKTATNKIIVSRAVSHAKMHEPQAVSDSQLAQARQILLVLCQSWIDG